MTEDDFDRYVTLERASRVTGTPIGTLREWLRKGAITKHTNAGGCLVLIDIHELRPRPKPDGRNGARV
jgi:hypothetical protein